MVTDVVHFSDGRLDYYSQGWAQFAAQRPEVITALPRKKNISYHEQAPPRRPPLKQRKSFHKTNRTPGRTPHYLSTAFRHPCCF